MKIKVNIIALGDSDQPGNKEVRAEDGATLDAVLESLKLDSAESYMVLVNGEAVPSGEWPGHTVRDGDELTVFPPIKGG